MAVFFFDGDQTLWDFQAMMRRALAATIGELRRLRPETGGDMSVEAFVTDREAAAERLRGQVTNLEQVRFEAFKQSPARLRLRDDDLAAHLNDFYLQRRFADVMLSTRRPAGPGRAATKPPCRPPVQRQLVPEAPRPGGLLPGRRPVTGPGRRKARLPDLRHRLRPVARGTANHGWRLAGQ